MSVGVCGCATHPYKCKGTRNPIPNFYSLARFQNLWMCLGRRALEMGILVSLGTHKQEMRVHAHERAHTRGGAHRHT